MKIALRTLFLILILRILNTFPSSAQPQSDSLNKSFGKVMNIPERISGNFGELRSNHFHAGIDYKTNEKIGYEVFAAADGYVARVRVSATGYGKAIYLSHPGGTTTVYAHLRAFYPELEDSIRKVQYSRQEFEIELFPSRDAFPVKKGQLIGYTGNSGASQGPHLHFETRNTQSEKPFNPESIGYSFPDTVPPVIAAVVLYNPGPAGALFGSNRYLYPVAPGQLRINDTLITREEFFLGIECFDKAGIEPNLLGIKKFQLLLNEIPVFKYEIDQFSFDETRLLNSMIDYPFKAITGRTIILCTKLPGNKLDFIGHVNPIPEFNENEIINASFIVEDYKKNMSEIRFNLKIDKQSKSGTLTPAGMKVRYGVQKIISDDEYRVRFKPRSLYEDCWIQHAFVPTTRSEHWSGILHLEPEAQAIHEAVTLQIKPSREVAGLENKLVVARIDNIGKVTSLGGTFEDGMVITTTRSLGAFVLQVDTVAPVATLPFWNIDEFTGRNMIIIPIQDNLSGIKKYRVDLNNNWALADYSMGAGTLTIYPEYIPVIITNFEIKVELEDKTGNRSTTNFTLPR